MKTSRFSAVRYGCVALGVSLLLLVAAWNAPRRATATGMGCSGTEERRGSDEMPQRCYLNDDCKSLPGGCTHLAGYGYHTYMDFMYVGDCEPASCPQSTRCVHCNGGLACAVYKTYARQGDCPDPVLGTTGYTMRANRCTGTEGG